MDYNTPDIRKGLIDDFPELALDLHFVVVSPWTFEYNCIAWALGMADRWVDTSTIPWHWWPSMVRKDGTEEALISVFEFFGFEQCDNDLMEDGYDKVALYSVNKRWQHAARIISDGVYHSKFGASHDAFHSAGDVLAQGYGCVYKFMKRPIADRTKTDMLKGVKPGVIHLPIMNPSKDSFMVYYQKKYFDENGSEYDFINGIFVLKK